jgi:hypothetical protein
MDDFRQCCHSRNFKDQNKVSYKTYGLVDEMLLQTVQLFIS